MGEDEGVLDPDSDDEHGGFAVTNPTGPSGGEQQYGQQQYGQPQPGQQQYGQDGQPWYQQQGGADQQQGWRPGPPAQQGYGEPEYGRQQYGTPSGGFPQQHGAPGYGEQGYAQPQAGWGQPYGAPAPSNGMGIGALVCGILAVVLGIVVGYLFFPALLGVVAVILGVLGMGKAKRGEATNRGMALAGTITGAIGVVITVLWIVFAIAVLSSGGFSGVYTG